MRDPDQDRADTAYDSILFDRAEAIPDIAECLVDAKKDATLRFTCVQLLGFTEDPRAVPHVQDALADPHPMVRAEACRALEDLRAKDAISALMERTQDLDPNVREAAREALIAMNAL